MMGQSACRKVSGINPPGNPVMGQPVSPAWVAACKNLTIVTAFFGFRCCRLWAARWISIEFL